jgi:SAM-dependent methyltransferase
MSGDGAAAPPSTGVESSGKTSEVWIDDGALLCRACVNVFPIASGVPILLTYATALSRRTFEEWPGAFRRELTDGGYHLPADTPPKGEEFVAASFSTEWADYDYGSTLWTAPLHDRIETFRAECGLRDGDLAGKQFCEIGCGLGILTNEAASGLGATAWGVDLSQAVFRAANQFKNNPRLHFVQASVFRLPFAGDTFDFLYSHGVLHHTWSTREAVKHAAAALRRDGTIYVWLYGHADVRISVVRQIAYAVEEVIRPFIARMPSPLATAVLLPSIPLYQLASAAGQRSGTHATRYTAQQALHAARDRFTPLYAHRHEVDEVEGWLTDMGFKAVQRVSGDTAAPSWRLAIDRNVAVRASERARAIELGAL